MNLKILSEQQLRDYRSVRIGYNYYYVSYTDVLDLFENDARIKEINKIVQSSE